MRDQAELDPLLTQDPDNAQGQRGTRKTPEALQRQDPAMPDQDSETCKTRQNWISHSRRTLTMPRASEGPEEPSATSNSCRTLTRPRASEGSKGRTLSRGTPAKTPLLQELPQNPTAIGGMQKLMRKPHDISRTQTQWNDRKPLHSCTHHPPVVTPFALART